MQAKLTLSLDKEVIEQAKEFSRRQHKSLSKMVESYLRLVAGKERKEEKLSPIVARLSGILPPDAADNFKEEYTGYLEKKYR
ncbi:MAG: hypothetical protein HGA96_17625 [Desulfobulbaceae bacterium]|nr:hypothetical protein [Desulfobulbaceae bacterium]